MRKGFLIYEEMRKYFSIYEEAVSHIWLRNCSILISLYMRKIWFSFFISVVEQESRRNTPPPSALSNNTIFFQLISRHISNNNTAAQQQHCFFYWSIRVPLTGPFPVGGEKPVGPLGEVPYVGYPAHLLVQAQQCPRISIHLPGGRANGTSPVESSLVLQREDDTRHLTDL